MPSMLPSLACSASLFALASRPSSPPQACELCTLDPRMMDCGHTACLHCVLVADKMLQCPCGETQDMPVGGVHALSRDYAALKQQPKRLVCFVCGDAATHSCEVCTDGHFCDADAMRHARGRGHDMHAVAAAAAAHVAVTCPTDHGARVVCGESNSMRFSLGIVCGCACVRVCMCVCVCVRVCVVAVAPHAP